MKLQDLSEELQSNNFEIRRENFYGESICLVTPKPDFYQWTQKNKFFRSSIWNENGDLISAGFPKFTNWGELPEEFPCPGEITGCTVTEKIDGSLLIVSKYKGNFIIRTRGTINAFTLPNGNELNLFKKEILPKLPDYKMEQWNHSYLFEWISTENVIVILPTKTNWILIGKIYHGDYSLETQQKLNEFAKEFNIPRPAQYKFPGFEELIKNVGEWQHKEGVVIYSSNDQALHKVKSAWYLTCHSMKTQLNTVDKIVDLWFSLGKPTLSEFENAITKKFDWELWKQIEDRAVLIIKTAERVNQKLKEIDKFVDSIKHLPTRKEQAEKILNQYQTQGLNSYAFSLLNGQISDKMYRNLLNIFLENPSGF